LKLVTKKWCGEAFGCIFGQEINNFDAKLKYFKSC